MTWTAPDPGPMPLGSDVAPMREVAHDYLVSMRWTLLNLCAGLTAEQLATRSVPPSTLSLLGLVRHLRKVERYWWLVLPGTADPIYPTRDEDFDDLDPATAEQALLDLQAEWVACDEAAAALDPDARFVHHGEEVGGALIPVHLVHEYARHMGHGDLLRQALDGATGR